MSADGRHIVFVAFNGELRNLWIMNADGSNQKQLTGAGLLFGSPQFTPDNQWVIYSSTPESGSIGIKKLSIDGGDPVPLTNYLAMLPSISSDGNLIAAGYLDEKQVPHIAIIPSVGGQPTKLLPLPLNLVPTGGFAWTPDSSAVVYVQQRSGVSNVWSQPIDGAPPKQLTNFKSDLIFRFALSSDGTSLLLARGNQTRDVVLIRDFL